MGESGKIFESVFLLTTGISVLLLVLITGLMVFFVIRYRSSRNPVPSDIEGNALLEVAWIVIPTIIVLVMFYYGWTGYRTLQQAPPGAMLVKVTAKMWSWDFAYENGRKSKELVVPVDRPVRLEMQSEDVIHSFFIPAFAVKQDIVPGMTNGMWFSGEVTGTFDIFCAEYCGTGHSKMLSLLKVVPVGEFESWLKGAEAGAKPAENPGKKLLDEKGCTGCHSLDGSDLLGPSLKGVFGRKTTVKTAGKERVITADEDYIRKSMLEPGADVVKGFDDLMPSQAGLLNDQEIGAIMEYLEKLK